MTPLDRHHLAAAVATELPASRFKASLLDAEGLRFFVAVKGEPACGARAWWVVLGEDLWSLRRADDDPNPNPVHGTYKAIAPTAKAIVNAVQADLTQWPGHVAGLTDDLERLGLRITGGGKMSITVDASELQRRMVPVVDAVETMKVALAGLPPAIRAETRCVLTICSETVTIAGPKSAGWVVDADADELEVLAMEHLGSADGESARHALAGALDGAT